MHRIPNAANHVLRRARIWLLVPLVVFGAIWLPSCAPRETWPFTICRLALTGIEDADARIRLLTRFEDTTDGGPVTLRYQLITPEMAGPAAPLPSDGAVHPLPSAHAAPDGVYSITCHYAPQVKPHTPTDLLAIETSHFGPVSVAHMALLKRFWIGRIGQEGLGGYVNIDDHGLGADVPDIGLGPAYLLQLGLAGLARGAVYGLLALAFTLIYGLIGRINLAFGEVVMTAALATAIMALWLASATGWMIPVMVTGGIAMAILAGSGLSHLTWRNVFGPLSTRAAGGQAMIVASLGCLLAIQEFVRIAVSARNFNLPPIWEFSVPLVRGDHFVVQLQGFDIVAIGGGMIVLAISGLIMARSNFGRNWRAISQDRLGAALCGISLRRIEGQSFVLAGFLCGLTGAMLTLRYGVINFHSGTLFGFKALTAAILGGIGRLRGAWLGGILIGLIETLWSGYFGAAYRDVAVFVLLAVILALRPAGLLGVNDSHDSLFAARNGQI